MKLENEFRLKSMYVAHFTWLSSAVYWERRVCQFLYYNATKAVDIEGEKCPPWLQRPKAFFCVSKHKASTLANNTNTKKQGE